ncbi:hypothetical protein [Methylobacterium planeticum]|uniref:Uncharacterized protein n=1 Tax=Methylobacterium planeticum TaxID=2615211 RepID=A0A6N6MQ09_9HYPH|nr:hypothetical protein [Methylobacterium planeticum]KAB1073642.1 hypothetical protein F6X51_10635 [Methylobacterium planeticum]
MSNRHDVRLLCGACGIPPEVGSETLRDRTATCPSCGRSDSYGAVLREAGRYLADRIVCAEIARPPRAGDVRLPPTSGDEAGFRWVAA